MIYQVWRLSEGGDGNLGLACTSEGLVLGRTPLIERQDGRFVVRDRSEIERLLGKAYRAEIVVDRLMPGLTTVAAALNANDQGLARIAAVHLRLPDLPDDAARDGMEAEDRLIKYARDEGTGSSDWNPALHPRTGTLPNPGWFAPTDGSASESFPVRTAQNDDPARRTDASASFASDNWVTLPPGEYIDELHDFLEWLANAKPEEEMKIRAEIRHYYYDVGDTIGGDILHDVFSNVLEAGDNKEWRQQLLNSIDAYAKADPAEMGLMHASLPSLILGLSELAAEAGIAQDLPEEAPALEGQTVEARAAAARSALDPWQYGWAKRGRIIHDLLGDGSLGPNFPVIDMIGGGVATSIKSIDLSAATYQDAARLIFRINKYDQALSEFDGATWGADVVKGSDILIRRLNLVVQKGKMTEVQRQAIEVVRRAAASRNFNPVEIVVTEM